MRDKLRQVESVAVTVEYQVGDLVQDCEGRRVGAHQGLLVHANHPGIECCVAALGLSEKQDLASAARSIHSGPDECVATDGEDDSVGSPSICLLKDAFYDVFAACVDRIFETVAGGDGVALGEEDRGKNPDARTTDEHNKQETERALTDDENGIVWPQVEHLHALQD